MQIHTPSPLQKAIWPAFVQADFEDRGLRLWVKRDDLIHPLISGNKWRKLRLNVEHCRQLKKEGIVSFGGAFSNHLLALAAAAHIAGLKSIGLVRGEELNSSSNAVLQKCHELGMELLFLTREEYNMRDDWEYLSELKSEFSSFYIVPEGGKNFYGIIGCQDIVGEIQEPFDDFWLPQGTSTTSIGVGMTLSDSQTLHVVPVIKGFEVENEMERLIMNTMNDESWMDEIRSRMHIHSNGHFGGYGKMTAELRDFIGKMKEEMDLKLDPIYSAKTFYTLLQYYAENKELRERDIVFLHTGGIYP